MAEAEKSIWKKEITFRRKPKEEPPAEAAPSPVPEKTSIWKKEISLGRKSKEHAVPAPPPAPPRPESVAALLRPLAETPAPSLPPVSAPSPDAPPPEPEPAATLAAPAAAPLETELLPPPAAESSPAEPSPAAAAPETPWTDAPSEPNAEAEPAADAAPDAEEAEPPAKERRGAAKAAKREAKADAKEAAARDRRARKNAREQQKRERYRKQKRLVGLKIGGTHLAAARVANNGRPRLLQIAEEPLERGIVVGGELREPEELTAVLKAFFKKHRLPRTAVRLGIASNRLGLRIFELSGIEDPKQLDNAIRFRAQETLPIPLDEAVLDYRILAEEIADNGVLTRRVLLVVAHRDLVDRYVTACRKAGLKLHGIDLEAFALLRALAAPEEPRADDAGVVVVSIGRDRSTLAVSDGAVCQYTRVLDWGGAALDAALARALEVSPSEAEPIKHSLSLVDADPAPEGMSDSAAAQLRAVIRAELQAFTRDLFASLRYYQEQPGSLGIAEILLTGGGARLRGLAQELERAIGVTVRVGDPLARVEPSRKVKKAAPDGTLAAAIGLGIED